MSNTFRPISNVVSLSTAANDVHKGTSVVVVTTSTTDRTITIANTENVATGGGKYGTFTTTSQAQVYLKAGEYVVINKKPTDTIKQDSGTDVRAFAIAKKE